MRLRTQFLLLTALVLTTVVVVILGVVIPRWQAELEEGARQRGRAVISMLARVCAEPAMVGNYSELQRAVDDLVLDPDVVYAAVLDRQGRVVVSSVNEEGRPFFRLEEPPPDPAGLLDPDRVEVLDAKTRVGGVQVLDFAAPLAVYKRSWGLARLGLDLASIRAATQSVARRMLWLGLAGLVLGAALVGLLAAGITRPLASLVGAARRLSQKRLDARVGLRGAREVVQLGAAFNQMAESLETHVREVEEQSSELQAGYRILTRLSTTMDRETLMEGVLEVITEVLEAAHCELMALDPREHSVDRFVHGKDGYQSSTLTARDFGVGRFEDITDLAGAIRRWMTPGDRDLFLPLAVDEIRMGGLLLSPRRADGFSASQRRLAEAVSTHLLVALENARLYNLAISDALTGLTIRRYFLARLQEELDRAHRYDRQFCLLMVDIDHFKEINDTRGHPAGDQVLRALGNRLKTALRRTDLLSRYGGEEFVVLLPSQAKQDGRRVAEKLRQAVVSRPFQAGQGPPVPITISIGVAAFPADGGTAEELMAKADEAMYNAKQAGRNLVRLAV